MLRAAQQRRRRHATMAAWAPSTVVAFCVAALAWHAAPSSSAGSVWTSSPFAWDTVETKLYTFCSNQSGNLSTASLEAIARTRMMIHGMEEYAMNPPVWQDSEGKIAQAAAQLRALSPRQPQLYTVQIDFARSVYASGAWFNAHPECVLRDATGDPVLNNSTQPSVGHCDANVSVPGKSYPFGACFVYGFNTQCGRDAWVKFIVDAVEGLGLDGIFIDGFQGIDPSVAGASTSFSRVTSKCTPAVASAWMQGLNQSLWALASALRGSNKTVICNDTGKTYDCDAERGCFCNASNDERFGGGVGDAVALMDYHRSSPQGGVIVHVPHINNNIGIFNQSFAGFLLGAHDNDGFGIGFQYDCALGGWLSLDRFPVGQKLGAPLADAMIELAGWPGANCTYLTPARPPPHLAETQGCLMSRSFASGVDVFVGQFHPPDHPTKPTNHGLCIWWSDGTVSSPNASNCPPRPSAT